MIMATENLIPINLVVADRTFRLRIKAEEEQAIRQRMKEVNEKIVEFKTAFAGKDLQDYISMCLIWYATQNATAPAEEIPADMEKRLEDLESRIDSVLTSRV
jgi:cell division protein ZapA